MKLRLYNTLQKARKPFVPLDMKAVRMYVCGPTVYDRIHVGNARPIIVFDILFRLLRHLYGAENVTYVRNITDIDDKINVRAEELGVDIRVLTDKTLAAFQEDIARLSVIQPTHEPRATDHIPDMIAMIARLVEVDAAYEAEGHVLFAVSQDKDYGCLAHRDEEEMLAGARVEVAPYKRHAGDFVLWKPSDATQPGWDSPWGRGRPGWHIECSAMSKHFLGDAFDLHGGGQDLIFPHHENEMAQSRCANDGAVQAHTWLHNGIITVGGEKMSKSLGNFITLHDACDACGPEVVRVVLLQTHYRSALDWNNEMTSMAKSTINRLYLALRDYEGLWDEPNAETPQIILDALSDDLNTPLALHHLHALATELNKDKKNIDLARQLKAGGAFLGILQQKPCAWLQSGCELSSEEIEALIRERQEAKANKDFARADAIRNQLQTSGIILEDTQGVTQWRKA